MSKLSKIDRRYTSDSHEPKAGGLSVRLGSHVAQVGHISTMSREERDQAAWDLKQILFARGIIPSLGGAR